MAAAPPSSMEKTTYFWLPQMSTVSERSDKPTPTEQQIFRTKRKYAAKCRTRLGFTGFVDEVLVTMPAHR
jgi:hypothetical protein